MSTQTGMGAPQILQESSPEIRFTGSENHSLFSERATLDAGGRLAWKLRARGSQAIRFEEKRGIAEFDGGSGLEMHMLGTCVGKAFSYLRGEFSLMPVECRGRVRFEIEIALENARSVLAVTSVYSDRRYEEELISVEQVVIPSDRTAFADLVLNLDRIPPRNSPVFGFVQVCLPVGPGSTVRVGEIVASTANGLRIRFDTFGDETKASSRLRAWKFVDLLRKKGHDVRIGGPRTEVDLYICQKVRPFSMLASVRKSNPRATVVYDFDDNFVLPEQGTLPELLAFINQVDVVTCGSEYLAESVRRWHSNVYVLENPLDVQDDAKCRSPRGELARIGWFGAPEGVRELAKTDLAGSVKVETITIGGDIEYNLDTVDEELMGFDLLLFPVEETPWNLAKNANRMMKALALGVPVLASATPEQSRIAAQTGLPPQCLVHSPEGWRRAIEQVREDYVKIEQATLAVRVCLRRTHSTAVILEGLLEHLQRTAGGPTRRASASSPCFSRIAVLIVDGSPQGRAMATVNQSMVKWAGFHSVHLLCAKKLRNEGFHLPGNNFRLADGDFLQTYKNADRVVAECEAEYLLVVPAGVALAHGMAAAIEEAMDREPVAWFVRNAYQSPSRIGEFSAPLLRELFLSPMPIGPLLVRTAWARESAVRWQSTYELWSWALLVKALGSGTPVAQIDLPFAFDSVQMDELNVSQRYACWLAEYRPQVARDLPNPENQWARMLTDIVSEAALDAGRDLCGITGHLYARYVTTRQKLAALEEELNKLRQAAPVPPDKRL